MKTELQRFYAAACLALQTAAYVLAILTALWLTVQIILKIFLGIYLSF